MKRKIIIGICMIFLFTLSRCGTNDSDSMKKDSGNQAENETVQIENMDTGIVLNKGEIEIYTDQKNIEWCSGMELQ